MSGALAAIDGSLEQLFTTAAWRGVTFWMTRSSDTAGLRLVRFWFPGIDADRTESLGGMEQGIRVEGLILGADYILRAKRMREALLAAGPAQLLHPWWGPIQCEVLEPGEISFSDRQLGVARFQATFRRVPVAPSGSVLDTIGDLLEAADGMVDAGTLMLEQLLSPLALPLSLLTAVTAIGGQAAAIWGAALGNVPQNLGTAAAPGIAALSAGLPAPVTNPDTSYADAVAALLAAVPAAIADTINDDTAPAVAPSGQVASVASDVDPRQVTTVLLGGAASLLAVAGSPAAGLTGSPLPVLAIAASALTISQAAFAATAIAYTSQSDALAWRATLDAALEAIADASPAAIAGAVSSAGIQSLTALLAAIRALRAAIAADISSRIGRLPAVSILVVPAQVSSWLVAQAVAGDDPSALVATLQDLIARNGVANPALCGPGPLEVLGVVA